MASKNFSYSYHQDDLKYLTSKTPAISSVARTLGVSPLDIAGGIIRELNNERYVYPQDYSNGLRRVLKETLVPLLTDEKIRQLYDEANTYKRSTLQLPSRPLTIWNRAFLGVGPGNINIRTAIDQLKNYNQWFPNSDPLDLKKYNAVDPKNPNNTGYKAFVRDIHDRTTDVTEKVSGLIAREAREFLKKNMGDSAWNALDEDHQAALVAKYYLLGKEKMEDTAAAQEAGPVGTYSPDYTGEGSDVYLYKSNPEAIKRALGRQGGYKLDPGFQRSAGADGDKNYGPIWNSLYGNHAPLAAKASVAVPPASWPPFIDRPIYNDPVNPYLPPPWFAKPSPPSTSGSAAKPWTPNDPASETPLARALREFDGQPAGDADRVGAPLPDPSAAPASDRQPVRFDYPLAVLAAMVRLSAMRDGGG